MSTLAIRLPLGPIEPFDEEPRRQTRQPRRRQSPEQRRALEVLEHAVEYLVDSRLSDQWETPADAEAVHLLMACSLAIYSGEQDARPWHERVQHSLLKRLHLKGTGKR